MGARRGAPRCKTSACLPGAQGPELAHITFFLYFTHCLASVHVSGIVSYAIAVILSRCGPSECVVVALSSLSPFLTHFFQAVQSHHAQGMRRRQAKTQSVALQRHQHRVSRAATGAGDDRAPQPRSHCSTKRRMRGMVHHPKPPGVGAEGQRRTRRGTF